MKTTRTLGQVKNGVIVPNIPIPEGFWVELEFAEEQMVFTPQEQLEFNEWEHASAGLVEKVEQLAEEAENDERRRNMAG